MERSKLVKGLLVLGIPTYVIGGFLIGSYLGGLAGNRAIGIVIGIFVGVGFAFYDAYYVLIKPLTGKTKR